MKVLALEVSNVQGAIPFSVPVCPISLLSVRIIRFMLKLRAENGYYPRICLTLWIFEVTSRSVHTTNCYIAKHKRQCSFWSGLLLVLFPALLAGQGYSRLDEKFGFKDLKFGMSMNQALSNISYSNFETVRPNETIRFSQSDLNSIGTFKVKLVTLSFQTSKLSEILLYIEGNENISGIMEALKMAYAAPKQVTYSSPDSLNYQKNKVFVWTQDAAASDMFNPANQTKTAAQVTANTGPKMNALLCEVESYEWDGKKVLLQYSVFRAVHYPITFAIMAVRDKANVIDLKKRDSVFIRFQRAAEDL
jgi:Cu/Ag efflux protein CusF